MPGFNTLPAVGGGGGQANMNYVASVHMQTFNRSWAQGGTAGYYGLFSVNQENGYAYFVGSGVSTGAPLNKLTNVSHAFTRIDIIAPTNDMISLYKAKVKSTTVFNNPFDADGTIGKSAIASFPSVITSSGNFVLPNNALPLISALVVGAGGGGGREHNGGGGGGGGAVMLTAYQAVGTTSVSIGSGANGQNTVGGRTYFGNVYALGGGGGSSHSYKQVDPSGQAANGGGGAGHATGAQSVGQAGNTQTTNTGMGSVGSPAYHGGFSGGHGGPNSQVGGGGGGGGAGANGSDGDGSVGGASGLGHMNSISGSSVEYGAGGNGGRSNSGSNTWGTSRFTGYSHGGTGAAQSNVGQSGGANGVVVVRYYIA